MVTASSTARAALEAAAGKENLREATETDAIGGVDVCLKSAVDDDFSGAHFAAGPRSVAGHDALAFVRQRHGLPLGDLDRVRRQQAFLAGLRPNPGVLPFVHALAEATGETVLLCQLHGKMPSRSPLPKGGGRTPCRPGRSASGYLPTPSPRGGLFWRGCRRRGWRRQCRRARRRARRTASASRNAADRAYRG